MIVAVLEGKAESHGLLKARDPHSSTIHSHASSNVQGRGWL